MAKVSKKERAELIDLGHKFAERACTGNDDPSLIDDDAIDYPESVAAKVYPWPDSPCHERFAIFRDAFVAWVKDTYYDDRAL